MKQVQIAGYGVPSEVVRCVELDDLSAPGPDEVIFEVLAFPINPADLWFCRGQYRLKPPLPATPGAECVGRILAVGTAVTGLAPGQRVINLMRENWASHRKVKAKDVVPIAEDLELGQAAMLRINPPTAALLLSDIVKLQPGDWVLDNVANSAVGRWVIRLARRRGLRTLNVVRRAALFDELRALGADACVVDGPDLAQQVHAVTGGTPLRLALDAVAGSATQRMAECVSDEGTVCVYGAMSADEPRIDRSALIYRGVMLTGFMLGRFMAKRDAKAIAGIYAELADELRTGALAIPIAARYPIERIADAVHHAEQGERGGKILVIPQ